MVKSAELYQPQTRKLEIDDDIDRNRRRRREANNGSPLCNAEPAEPQPAAGALTSANPKSITTMIAGGWTWAAMIRVVMMSNIAFNAGRSNIVAWGETP